MQKDEVGNLIYELQFLRGVVASIQQRIGLINASISELQSAISTLEGISNEGSGSSLLVPIGGGSYVRARLDDEKRLIVGIGADVAMEKTVGEAKEEFQTRTLELENVREALLKQLDEASTRMDGLQREVQKIAQKTG